MPADLKLKLYRGPAAETVFLLSLLQLAELYLEKVRLNPEPIKMSSEECAQYAATTKCYLCVHSAKDKVADHCHLTDTFRGAACGDCHKKAKMPGFLTVFFHNLTGYDGHVIIKTIQKLQD